MLTHRFYLQARLVFKVQDLTATVQLAVAAISGTLLLPGWHNDVQRKSKWNKIKRK